MPDPYKGFDLGNDPQSAPGGRNHLLVIAIDEYAHCPKLYNCVKDAREFIEVLTEKYRFEPENVTTLFNAEATRPSIHTQLKKLKSEVGRDDNLVVYFSGHGETEDNVGYWAPVNAHPGHEWEYFSTDEIKRRLDAIDSFHTFVIVDACFSGSLFTSYKSAAPGYESKRSRWGLAASHSRERALDGTAGENSPFAATLLHQLRGSRDNLPVQDLAAAVIRQVEQATEGRQTPVFKPLNVRGDDSGQYVFRLKANEAADWKACREAGTAGAYRAFLAQYPAGAHAGDARATLAKLEEEAAWATASKTNAVASYNAYLGRYPAGPHAEEAFQRIRQLEDDAGWSESKRIDRAYAYWDYLRRFPGGRHQEQARARIRELEQPAYGAAEAPPAAKAEGAAMPPPKPKAANKEDAPPAPFRWRRNLLAGLGLAAVLLLGLWGVQRLTDKPPAENEVDNQLELFSGNDGKYGYQDQSGKEVIAAIYDSAGFFQDGQAVVILDGQTFTIDSTGACVAGCPEDKDTAAWAEAEGLDNIDAYKNYQEAFPKGQFYDEAGKRIKAFEAQLLRDEAARQDQQAWEAARKKDDVAAYENYQKSYPAGQYYQQAQKRIDALKSQERQAEAARKEERAWQDAKNKNTIAAYKSYQAAYPGGKYYSEAGKKIRELEDAAKQPAVRAITLNGLSWTAQNLDIDVPDSWCYEDKAANCRKYGRLYTLAAAKKACAALGKGWRLPTDEEWKSLANAYGGYYDWNTSKDVGNPKQAYSALIEGGSSGFAALLGGWRNTDGRFNNLGDYGDYWSATESGGSNAWRYSFDRNYGKLVRGANGKGFGFSCRCVQD